MLSNLFMASINNDGRSPTLRSSAPVAPLVIPSPTIANPLHHLHHAKSSPAIHHPSASPTSSPSSFTLKLGANRIPRPSSSSSSPATLPVSTSVTSLSIAIPASSSPSSRSAPSNNAGSAASSHCASSSVSSAMLIASAARAAGDLSLAPVAHSPSRASPTPSASASFKSNNKWAAAHASNLLVHGGSSDLDDQIDRLNASIRLALHWAVNTAIQPHTRRLYYEYRPPVVGADVTNGVPPSTTKSTTLARYPVILQQQVPAGAGGRVLRRDAVAELQSLFRLYTAFLTVPPSDPVAQRSFSFSIRSILSFYTDLLTPLALSPTSTAHQLPAALASITPLTLDDRALQEPCSIAALAALLDLLTLIGHAPLPRTQFASNIDDHAWVERTADGLAVTLVLLSDDARWLPAYVPSCSSRAFGGTQRAPSVDDSRAVLDALCGLARYVAARNTTSVGNSEHRTLAVVVGGVVRKVARTHLDLCAPAASATAAASRRSRQVSSPPSVHVHGGDWDPASVMDFDDDQDHQDAHQHMNKKRPSSPHAHHHGHDSTSDSDSDPEADNEDTYTSERVAIAVRVTRLALLVRATDPDLVDDAIAHWDALSAAHYFVPLTVVAAHASPQAARAAKHATRYQYSTAELARIVESLTQLLPHLDPVRRAMLKSPLAAAARELANRQVVRGADRLAVGGFVCRAMTTTASATAGPRWVSSPLAGRAPASVAGAGPREECQAHHVPIIAEAIGALVVVVKGLSERVASGTASPGSWRDDDDEEQLDARASRAWSPPLV
ncbi:hypothetical protein BCR44DRAFT_1514299 [Catenaria anguillulae PL171]|uniref:Uncharacterized protein n=1 Tax=Catenaria anguillulae PL171 TaxID=765915 RepID=A0A1Y2HJT0_9FUNG|nr:hypothetical protein BCR44DRAFT_1514299 [Catenaria anguillulae PL171]